MQSIQAETLEELGAILREIRQSQGLELSQLAARLYINSEYLEALEKGDWQALPSDAYGTGYLRRYATQVGLPVEPTIKLAKQLLGRSQAQPHFSAKLNNHPTPSNRLMLTASFLVIGLLASWQLSTHILGITEYDKKVTLSFTSVAKTLPEPALHCASLSRKITHPCHYIHLKETENPFFIRAYRPLAQISTEHPQHFFLHLTLKPLHD